MVKNNDQAYPIPAVRALIANGQGQVLLLKRANTNYGNNLWCLPGGKVEIGQTVAEALANELAEELSVRLVSAQFFFYQDRLPLEPSGLHCINFYFRCEVKGTLAMNEESADFAWIGLEDVSDYEITFRNEEAIRLHYGSGALLNIP